MEPAQATHRQRSDALRGLPEKPLGGTGVSTQLLWDEGSTEHRTGRQLRPRHTQGPLLAKGQARSEQLKRGRAARPERPRPVVGGQPRAVGAWAPGALTAAGEGAPRLAHSTPSPQLSTAALSPRPECPSTGHGASAAPHDTDLQPPPNREETKCPHGAPGERGPGQRGAAEGLRTGGQPSGAGAVPQRLPRRAPRRALKIAARREAKSRRPWAFL